MTTENVIPEIEEQNARFGRKAPESVYHKYEPNKTMIGSGKAFQGVSPMDFYLRQNAQKKAERAKEAETKVKLYENQLGKAFFGWGPSWRSWRRNFMAEVMKHLLTS